jgi:hypothetical protein
VLGPAAFFTRPSPTSALAHLAGTVASSSSLKAHFGNILGFVTSPSEPIEYFSMTVPRLLASLSSTLKPNERPVGIGFALVPLPLTVVLAICTSYTFIAAATPVTANTAAIARAAIQSFRMPPPRG